MKIRADNPAAHAAVTIHRKMIRDPLDTRALKPVADNAKVGDGSGLIAKGKWRGMPMYQLSLEERATCPRDCEQWLACYGNNMPMAHRIAHADEGALMLGLTAELDELAMQHPTGFVVRLHVLGDFFSVDYVDFWREALDVHPMLHLWGFTHRVDAIGEAIASMNGDRCWIRFSDTGTQLSANVADADGQGVGIACPQQSGRTKSCLTCGICWSARAPVLFQSH